MGYYFAIRYHLFLFMYYIISFIIILYIMHLHYIVYLISFILYVFILTDLFYVYILLYFRFHLLLLLLLITFVPSLYHIMLHTGSIVLPGHLVWGQFHGLGC